ncbi:unnamed protein product [Clonostachys rosea f. rosea IK726]|uniref:Uncharacterized protein n=1 Tax=Clonostachys rosea f. rosea IK726 TaxID=1349383 RepID=A0ACA9U4J1_BIOOC|nr:unnamed protein product [Clonostachys rosea f. rosea IK726]
MKFFTLVIYLLLQLATRSIRPAIAQSWPVHDNGLNKVVSGRDHYSLIVNGERVFVWSGELHLWRIPVPELWQDILEKIKAAGFNGIGLYELWGWHAPNNETLDFETGAHDFATIFDIAKVLGLYVVYRPGPHSNAEATGGGFPGWLTTGEYGPLRDDDPRYTAAWERYSGAVAEYVRPHLITNGGPVILWQIENEYGVQWLDPDAKVPNETAIAYMEQLQNHHRAWEIDVPFMGNNPNMWTRSWSKDYGNTGAEVDLYGLDHYPACWTCNLEICLPVNGAVEPYTVFDYYTHFQQVSPTQPSFLMEFQGGSYNPWDGPAGGCGELMDSIWVNMFYRHNLAEKVSAVNIYMLMGGTNWGNLGFPEVGTSYDYSSPIHENRLISEKYNEGKLFGLFMRVARDFAKVERIGNGTAYTTNAEVMATELRNPDTGARFYITRHDYSPSTEKSQFRLRISTESGNFLVPQQGSLTLDSISSKTIVTDFRIGATNKKIAYSKVEILTVSDLGERQVVVLWAPRGEDGEILLRGATSAKVASDNAGAETSFTVTEHGLIANFKIQERNIVIDIDNGVQLVVVDRDSGYQIWAPTLTADPQAWENKTVLVHGPYLVRSAAIDGDSLALRGDWSNETAVEIWAPSDIREVTFNGDKLATERSAYGSLIGLLPATQVTVDTIAAQLPSLGSWKVANGLPESALEYDDSRWTDANHMTTPNFSPPDTYPVLYADEYGYQAGNLLWRGHFNVTEDKRPSSAYLRVIGGLASGFSAYVNGHFVGTWLGSISNKTGELKVSLEDVQFNVGADNVLFIIQDTTGKDQREGAPDPRGILNASLFASDGSSLNFTSWKLTGNAGGNHLIEPVRGTWNEGGLHAERLGWHLPGFDDSDWEDGLPSEGFKGADARFYRTVVSLDMPRGFDVHLGFELNRLPHAKLRAQLYVNGYMFGKIIPISNEFSFPVFPGILNYHGENTIGLSI